MKLTPKIGENKKIGKKKFLWRVNTAWFALYKGVGWLGGVYIRLSASYKYLHVIVIT